MSFLIYQRLRGKTTFWLDWIGFSCRNSSTEIHRKSSNHSHTHTLLVGVSSIRIFGLVHGGNSHAGSRRKKKIVRVKSIQVHGSDKHSIKMQMETIASTNITWQVMKSLSRKTCRFHLIQIFTISLLYLFSYFLFRQNNDGNKIVIRVFRRSFCMYDFVLISLDLLFACIWP